MTCYDGGMAGMRWVALLRGVNVAGHHRIAMADLRQAMTDAGATDVATYIQSGNLVFDAGTDDPEAAVTIVGDAVEAAAGFRVPAVVRTVPELSRIADAHPDRDGAVPAKWLHVVLLDRVADPTQAPDPERFRPDRLVVAGAELYLTYPEGVGRSKLTVALLERAFDVVGTGRNLTTLRRLVDIGRS